MEKVKSVEDSFLKIWSDMVCLDRQYHFKFFKGCLPQILLGPFLNTLTYLIKNYKELNKYFYNNGLLHKKSKH